MGLTDHHFKMAYIDCYPKRVLTVIVDCCHTRTPLTNTVLLTVIINTFWMGNNLISKTKGPS